MNTTQTHSYSPEAFDDVSARIPRIRAVAQALGIHPEAIYGALVEENHDYRQGWLKNALGDAWALSQSRDHAAMARDYQHAGRQGKLGEHDTWDKLNPVLNDVGPYNIQLGTAIRLLHAYSESTPSGQEPLNLRRFRDDYPALPSGLAEGVVAPEFAGLMLKEAYQYMATHADPDYWSPLPPDQQDAIAITYYNMGRAKIEKRRPDNIQQHGGKYLPQPGEEAAAGKNHLANAETIGGLFGNPNYHHPASPSSQEPTARRLPPEHFLDVHAPHSISLKAGGTLSDIVACENARGNPLTVDDLRLANGLLPDQDRRIPEGMRLLVPQRSVEGKLTIDRFDGSFTLRSTDDYGIRLLSRYWDGEKFHDRYTHHDAAGRLLQERDFAVGGDYARLFRSLYRDWSERMVPVTSSAIHSLSHNRCLPILTVQFSRGQVYDYYDVPYRVYEEFLAAQSKGQYLNENIRRYYGYRRIK
jgi:hypothetical protein